MNSNSNLNLPAYLELGIKFGVRDSTGQVYSNIKDFFLLSKILRLSDLQAGFLEAPNKTGQRYQLTIDKRLKELILKNGEASTIISFQRKTEGCFAVARLFESTRIKETS